MNGLIKLEGIEKPEIPENWDYEDSINKMQPIVYKWKNITIGMASEIYIAREVLRKDKSKRSQWGKYCEAIGVTKETANNWINSIFMSNNRHDNVIDITPTMPEGVFNVVYADPPWQYNDKQDTKKLGGAVKHYRTLSIEELCDLEVKESFHDNTVLFLWTTSPLLEDSFKVISAWGFEYKTSFVWDKVDHNMGHYNSVRHEFLLVCTKGSFTPEVKKLFDSVVSVEKNKIHSKKPDIFYEIIETLYPSGNKIELFAREKRAGWASWGDEIDNI